MSRTNYKRMPDGVDAKTSGRNGRAARSSANGSSSAQIVLGLTTNIGEMTKMNNKLDRALARLGTPADKPEFRDHLHDDQNAFNALVKDLLSSLQAAKPLLDSQQFTRLSLQFDAAYKRYQKLTSALDSKQKALLAAHISSADADPQAHHADYGAALLQQQEEEDVQFTEWEHDEVVRRVEEIKQIEGEVAEVAELYKDLAGLVNDQQGSIDQVSENVIEVKVKVQEGEVQLEGAETQQKKGRRRKCCVVAIGLSCIVVAALLIVVLKK